MGDGTKPTTSKQEATASVQEVSLETSHDEDGAVRLTGYDGCFELPEYITKALQDKGVIIDL